MSTWTIYPLSVFVNVLAGLAISIVGAPVMIGLAKRIGLMDVPGSLPHKKHDRPIPLAGGMTLILVLIVGGVVLNWSMLRELWRILLPALMVFALGIWDDFFRLPAWLKLLGQILATGLLISLGTYVQIFPAGVFGISSTVSLYVNLLITLLWVVGVTNAFNFIDSMDGIVVGIAGIALAFLVLVTFNSSQVALLRLITLMLGACIGLFFHNMTPSRLFLGDSGAQTIGFLLSVIAILYTPDRLPQAASWFLPILVLGVPIFDTCLVVFSRLKRNKPVYLAGRNHTYHRLVNLGLDSNRAVAVMHLAGITLGCIAFIALHLTPVLANLLFASTLLAGMAIYIFLERKAG
jgi:UDP-GlcNAc:undecaprenyl-phosphate GlcNAc-1-phosphate transferase